MGYYCPANLLFSIFLMFFRLQSLVSKLMVVTGPWISWIPLIIFDFTQKNLKNLQEKYFFLYNSRKTSTSIKIRSNRNLFHLFLPSTPFQNVEFKNFLQVSSLIVLVFWMNSLIALSTATNNFLIKLLFAMFTSWNYFPSNLNYCLKWILW